MRFVGEAQRANRRGGGDAHRAVDARRTMRVAKPSSLRRDRERLLGSVDGCDCPSLIARIVPVLFLVVDGCDCPSPRDDSAERRHLFGAIRVPVVVSVRVRVWVSGRRVPPRGHAAYFRRVRPLEGVHDDRLRAGSTRHLVARLEEKLGGESWESRRVRHGGEPRDEESVDDGDDVGSAAREDARGGERVSRGGMVVRDVDVCGGGEGVQDVRRVSDGAWCAFRAREEVRVFRARAKTLVALGRGVGATRDDVDGEFGEGGARDDVHADAGERRPRGSGDAGRGGARGGARRVDARTRARSRRRPRRESRRGGRESPRRARRGRRARPCGKRSGRRGSAGWSGGVRKVGGGRAGQRRRGRADVVARPRSHRRFSRNATFCANDAGARDPERARGGTLRAGQPTSRKRLERDGEGGARARGPGGPRVRTE